MGYEFVSEIENKLKDSVLAFDSLTQNTSKIILLNEFDEDTGDPMIAICRYDKNMDEGTTIVNEITSVYDKERFINFLTKSYKENKQFFKNEKTEQYFIPIWLQLPEDMRYALSDSYGKQVFNKSQVEQDRTNHIRKVSKKNLHKEDDFLTRLKELQKQQKHPGKKKEKKRSDGFIR